METLKAVRVLPYHLTDETLTKYIRPASDTGRLIEEPPLEMPWDSYITFGCGVKPVIQILSNRHYEPDDSDNDEPVPQDLLDLLNWAVDNNISYIELAFEDTGYYNSWDEIKEKAAITGLPLYGISEADFSENDECDDNDAESSNDTFDLTAEELLEIMVDIHQSYDTRHACFKCPLFRDNNETCADLCQPAEFPKGVELGMMDELIRICLKWKSEHPKTI